MDLDLAQLLTSAAEVGARHRQTVASRPVQPTPDLTALAAAFGGDLPFEPTAPDEVVRQLVEAATPALMGTVGPRFFGFVIGGSSQQPRPPTSSPHAGTSARTTQSSRPRQPRRSAQRVDGPKSCSACRPPPRSAS